MGIQKVAKQVILDELEEQTHPEAVEDVIFWALEEYGKNHPDSWGGLIARAIVSRIKEEEGEYQSKNN